MTLNEVLRRMLDERGVEWEARDYFEQTTQWSTYNGAFVYWARERDGKLLVETTAPTKCSASCTPAQAIAATLGVEPDDAAMVKLHDRMNAALLEYERAQGIEQRDGDSEVVVPWVVKMHALLEEAAALGSSNCSNSERTEIDKAAERIEVLASLAREYLHRYGMLMSLAGDDVTDETMAIDKLIVEVVGRGPTDGRP